MEKCLITKLSKSIDNDSLPYVGVMDFKLKGNGFAYIDVNENATVKFDKETTFKVGSDIGSGTTISVPAGKRLTITSTTDERNMSIYPKYGITYIDCSVDGLLSFNIDNLSYSKDILSIGYVRKPQLTGDLSSLSGLSKLQTLYVNSTQLTGDLSSLSGLSELQTLYVNGTQLTGDLSSLSGLSKLKTLYVNSTQLTGDLSSLSGLSELQDCRLYRFNKLTGDLSLLPASVYNFDTDEDYSFMWTKGKRINVNMIESYRYINMGSYIDDMLIDEATCTHNSSAFNRLALIGVRTSASDNALNTIQSKGVTVLIKDE